MRGATEIVRNRIAMGSLMLSVATLPFSVKLCHFFVIVFIVTWFSEGDWRAKLALINESLLLKLLILFITLQVLGLLFAEDLTVGWLSLEKKIFLLTLPVCIATTSMKSTKNDIRLILAIFVASCFAGSIYCIFHSWQETNLVLAGEHSLNPYLSGSQYFTLHPLASDRWLTFSYVSLSSGIDIHPTYFSLFLAFGIIFLLSEYASLTSWFQRTVALAVILYFAVFIIFLSSRIIIFSMVIVLLYVVGMCTYRRKRSHAFLATAVAVLFCSFVVLNPVTRYRSLQEIEDTAFEIDRGSNYTTAAQIRYSLWWIAAKSLRDFNPLIGYGTGDVEKTMAWTSKEEGITNSIGSVDPHNQFLYTLLANGVPALTVLIFILMGPVYLGWSHNDPLLLGASFLFLLLCMTESALELQKGIIFYSLVTGLLFFQHSLQISDINFKSQVHAE